MKRKRFTEEQIIGILNEAEQAGNIREVCRLNNITEQTLLPLADEIRRDGRFGRQAVEGA